MRCGRGREGLQNPRLSSQEKTYEGHPRYRHSGNRQILPCHCSWEGGGVTPESVIASLREFNRRDAEFRRTHPESKLGYVGPGLRPRNAQWVLVNVCGIPFEKASALIAEAA